MKPKVESSQNAKGRKHLYLHSIREQKQVQLLKLLSNYLTIKTIAKTLKISDKMVYKRRLTYIKSGWLNHDNSLTSYGKQKVECCSRWGSKGRILPNDIRLHNLTFKIKVSPNIQRKWKLNREKLLTLKDITFSNIHMHNWTANQIIINNVKVWLNPRQILFFMPNYYGKTPLECFTKALDDLTKLTNKLQRTLGVKLFSSKFLDFEISRQHYALIKNQLAEKYNKERKKLFIYDSRHELRLLIDNSLNLNEFEAVHHKEAMSDSEKVKNFFNEVIEKDLSLSSAYNDLHDTKRIIKEISSNQANLSVVLSQLNQNVITIVNKLGER